MPQLTVLLQTFRGMFLSPGRAHQVFLVFSRPYAELFATKTPQGGGTKGTDIQMIVEEDVEKAMSWNSIDSSSTNPSLIILCVPGRHETCRLGQA